MSEPISYNMRGASAASGLSTSHLDRAIRAGKLPAKRTSKNEKGEPTGSFVILRADLETYLRTELVDA